MKKRWTWSVVVVAGLAAQVCGAVEAVAGKSGPAPGESDEIVVHGTALWALREDVIKAEDRFYAAFNQLNQVDDFDVECKWDAPTGTRIRQRKCLTKVALRAQQVYASDYVNFLQGSGPMPDNDPGMVLLDRYGEFKENVLYLLKMNPELRRLVRERANAVKRYNDERRKRFKGRLVMYR